MSTVNTSVNLNEGNLNVVLYDTSIKELIMCLTAFRKERERIRIKSKQVYIRKKKAKLSASSDVSTPVASA